MIRAMEKATSLCTSLFVAIDLPAAEEWPSPFLVFMFLPDLKCISKASSQKHFGCDSYILEESHQSFIHYTHPFSPHMYPSNAQFAKSTRSK